MEESAGAPIRTRKWPALALTKNAPGKKVWNTGSSRNRSKTTTGPRRKGKLSGKIKILLDKNDKLLGCQMIGAHAGELIHEWIIALSGGVKLSTMAGAVHVYPTLSEISKRAAGRVFADKLFGDRTKSILKFLFSLKGRACLLPDEQK